MCLRLIALLIKSVPTDVDLNCSLHKQYNSRRIILQGEHSPPPSSQMAIIIFPRKTVRDKSYL